MAFGSSQKRTPALPAPAIEPGAVRPVALAEASRALAEAKRQAGAEPVASDAERLVDQLANRIGGLGVELADVAGNLQEVAGRGSSQADRFGHLQKTAETKASANTGIATDSARGT